MPYTRNKKALHITKGCHSKFYWEFYEHCTLELQI